jgi:tagatose 6-phosphate kinase
MIVTITLNFALDVTYRVARLTPGATHRVEMEQRAGGKGVNVARVLTALGTDAVVCGLAGGGTGLLALAELRAAGLRARMTRVAGESRRTVTVVETSAGDATGFWEPGPVISDAEWTAFLEDFDAIAPAADAVVLSGSIPPVSRRTRTRCCASGPRAPACPPCSMPTARPCASAWRAGRTS